MTTRGRKSIVELRPRYMFGYDFMQRLQEAGLIGKGIQRVVIDVKHDSYAVMYVQQAVDERVLDVLVGLPGLQVKAVGLGEIAELVAPRKRKAAEVRKTRPA